MTSWTDERILQLTALWLGGHSASTVARQLGGVTRNAVIGKVHRLGLSGRATPSAPGAPRPPATVKPPRTASRPRAKAAVATVQRLRLLDVGASAPEIDECEPRVPLLKLSAGGCRFGLGDPRDEAFGFCPETAVRGRYCARHAGIVFQPSPPSRPGADRRLAALLRLA